VLGRDLTAEARALLRTDAARWHADVTERGFSMALGRLGAPVDDTAVLVFARDGEGTLRGLLQLVPWGSAGWSLDVMRRDPEAANGINELLITAALRAARDLGIGRLSLNFAMFRRTLEHGERLGAGVVAVALRRVLVEASRWWQIESLYRFNSKFQPEWETRYVCSPTRADLPRVIVATLIAEALVQPPRRLGRSRRLAFE
jgi:lysyl-tRNA synthetase class 2